MKLEFKPPYLDYGLGADEISDETLVHSIEPIRDGQITQVIWSFPSEPEKRIVYDCYRHSPYHDHYQYIYNIGLARQSDLPDNDEEPNVILKPNPYIIQALF